MNPIVVMKALLCLALVAIVGCGKPNNVATLQHEANDVATYYQPKLEAVDKRVQQIFRRGTTIPANLPGIDEVGKRLTEARDLIVQLRGIVMPGPDGRSAVAKQAEAAAKERKVADLKKLIHDTETTLANGMTVIHDNLSAVESWIALYDQNRLTSGGAPELPTPPAEAPSAPAPAPTPTPPTPTPAPPAP